MLYRIILGYFRAKFIRFILGSILSKKNQGKHLKSLTLIEYGLELLNVYLMERKKTTPRTRR